MLYKSSRRINTIGVAIYLLLVFLNLLKGNLTSINALIVLLGGYLFLNNFLYIKKNHFILLIVFSFFSLFSILSLYIFQGKITYTPIRVFVHFSLMITVIRYGINKNMVKYSLYLFVFFILYAVFVRQIYINLIFPGISKNIIGWLALGLATLYYSLELNAIKNKTKLNVFPALVTLFICLVSLSRSSIACSFILMLIVSFYSYRHISRKNKIIVSISIISIFIILYNYLSEFINISLQRFDQRGFDSHERSIFIEGYIEKLNFATVLFGVDSNQSPFTLIDGNFHNSFLLGHSNFGLMFVFFLLFLIYYLTKNIYSNLYLVVLGSVLLLRSYTDTIMFVGDLDFVLFVVLYKMKPSFKIRNT